MKKNYTGKIIFQSEIGFFKKNDAQFCHLSILSWTTIILLFPGTYNSHFTLLNLLFKIYSPKFTFSPVYRSRTISVFSLKYLSVKKSFDTKTREDRAGYGIRSHTFNRFLFAENIWGQYQCPVQQ